MFYGVKQSFILFVLFFLPNKPTHATLSFTVSLLTKCRILNHVKKNTFVTTAMILFNIKLYFKQPQFVRILRLDDLT